MHYVVYDSAELVSYSHFFLDKEGLHYPDCDTHVAINQPLIDKELPSFSDKAQYMCNYKLKDNFTSPVIESYLINKVQHGKDMFGEEKIAISHYYIDLRPVIFTKKLLKFRANQS